MDILKQLENILKEMDKQKQRVVIHSQIYNKYKVEFEELEKSNFTKIIINDLVPINKILVMKSEADIEKELFKNIPLLPIGLY